MSRELASILFTEHGGTFEREIVHHGTQIANGRLRLVSTSSQGKKGRRLALTHVIKFPNAEAAQNGVEAAKRYIAQRNIKAEVYGISIPGQQNRAVLKIFDPELAQRWRGYFSAGDSGEKSLRK